MPTVCLPDQNRPASDLRSDAEVVPFENSELAESDHRIANHLALLISYVRLKTADMDNQREAPSRQAVHMLLEGVGAQIAAIARLHRAMVSDNLPTRVDLGLHLHEICAPFAQGLRGVAEIVEEFAPGCLVQRDQILPLSQIAAEIVTNALKHACEGAEPSVVRVRCLADATGAVQMEIVDSGGGFPADFDPASDGGFGFRLVRGLSRKLEARIAFESTPVGVRFRLTLPKPLNGPQSEEANVPR